MFLKANPIISFPAGELLSIRVKQEFVRSRVNGSEGMCARSSVMKRPISGREMKCP